MTGRSDRIPSNGNGGRPSKLDRQVSTTSSRIQRLEHWIECRFVLTALLFFGMMHQYMMRANLSVAMVAMVDTKQMMRDENRSIAACPVDEKDAVISSDDMNVSSVVGEHEREEFGGPSFEWDAPTRGWILGAFYYGYWSTQILGGFMEHRFGGKIVFGGSVFMSSVLTLLTPIMAGLGPWALMATRVLLGVCQGPMYPSHHGMWGKWAPPLARSRLISIAMTGTYIGTAISYNLSGYLARHGFAGGWPSVFYVLGISGMIWCFFWAIFAFDSPAKHPRISEKERRYIEQSIGTNTQDTTLEIPWRGIFTSPIFWGLFIGHFCSNYGIYNLLTNLPSYIDQVLGFNIKTNSAVAAIPFISLWFFTTASGWIADSIRQRRMMSTLNVRRVLIVIAQFVPTIFLIVAGYMGCRPVVAIAMVSLAAGFSGFATPGFKVCHIEIAPRYSGILYSFTNTFATFSGQVSPLVAGYVTGSIADPKEAWRIVFYVGAVVSAIGGFAVLATLKTDVQDWARMEKDFYETEDKKGKSLPSVTPTDNDESTEGFFKTEQV